MRMIYSREHHNDAAPLDQTLESLLEQAKERVGSIAAHLYDILPFGCDEGSVGERLESVYRQEISVLEEALSGRASD